MKKSFELDDKLKGCVVKIEYDPTTRTGTVYLEKGTCVDARSTWDLFTAIDKNVLIIKTFSGDFLDMVYSRETVKGDWKAVLYRHTASQTN